MGKYLFFFFLWWIRLFLFLTLLNSSLTSSSPSPSHVLPSVWNDGIKNTPYHVRISFSNQLGTMNLAWNSISSAAQKQFVEYGRFPGELKRSAPAQVEESQLEKRNDSLITWIYSARMGGLPPSSKIYYRIAILLENGKLDHTETKYFLSKPESGRIKNIRFVAYGDQGERTEDAFHVANQLTKLVPPHSNAPLHFALHVGDLAYVFNNFTKWNVWSSMMSDIISTTPYMVTAGNRDEPETLRERMPMPSPYQPMKGHDNLYYEFDYGHLAVVTVSYYDLIHDQYSLDSPQFIWLDQTLERYHLRVQDPNDSMNWIIFATHTPLYSSSDGHKGGNEKLREAIEHLLLKYEVSIGIFGDDHNYERTYPIFDSEPDLDFIESKDKNGKISLFNNPKKTIHLLVGTAGIKLDGWISETPPSWSAFREISHGFAKFDISTTECKVQYIRSDGTIGDQFIIAKGENIGNSLLYLPSQVFTFYLVVVLLGLGIFCIKRRPHLINNFYWKIR